VLKDIRRKHRLSEKRLGELCGKSRHWIRKVERTGLESVAFGDVLKLARILCCSVEELVRDGEPWTSIEDSKTGIFYRVYYDAVKGVNILTCDIHMVCSYGVHDLSQIGYLTEDARAKMLQMVKESAFIRKKMPYE
jgi:transcriptional regulator with XRE-family HTH domain